MRAFRRPFPPELFYSQIVPDLLSEHIHLLLFENVIPQWNPFYILPRVSRDFHAMVCMMHKSIFGTEVDEEVDKVLYKAREFWAISRRPILRSVPIIDQHTEEPFTYAELMSSNSLIQIYICTAIAHSFFNFDVQYGIELEKQALDDVDSDLARRWVGRPRRFTMPDENMHRVYCPLMCAIRLCDRIRPDRLAYNISKHLAYIVPYFATAPLLLKYSQDLEDSVTGQRNVDMDTLVDQMSLTLKLIEETPRVLRSMQRRGELVTSFNRSSCIPRQVLKDTKVRDVVRTIVDRDWGPDTDIICGRAQDLLEEWDFAD